MARVLFGGSVGSLSPLQAVQLASSLNALRGGKGGLNPLGALQSAAGISRLRVLGADETTGRETSLAAGNTSPTTSMSRSSPTRAAIPPPSLKSR
jgi:translocation and assembly module TamB